MPTVELVLLLERAIRLIGVVGRWVRAGLLWLAGRRSSVVGRSPGAASVSGGASLRPPTNRLPPVVRGQQALRESLRELLRSPAGRVEVLAGVGGAGKTTVALELAHQVISRTRRRVPAWWVYANEPDSLMDGLASLTRVLDGNDVDIHAVRAGSGAARDRLWELLEQARPGWLLVFDNADRPELLDPDADGRGWLRPSHRGLVLVTSRLRDARQWGRDAAVHEVHLLAVADGAKLLIDLAGHPLSSLPGRDSHQLSDLESESDARALAAALGRLPLALHLAGTYLGTRQVRHRSFRAYQQAFESGVDVLSPPGIVRADPRMVVRQTWEMSLDYLHEHGIPQARQLLRLLSCYAPATPVPASLLRQEGVRALDAPGRLTPGGDCAWQRWLDDGLHGLVQLSMLEPTEDPAGAAPEPGWSVHAVIAEASRAHLVGAAPTFSGARPEPNSQTIRRIAVTLLGTAIQPLRPDDNRDWARYAMLVPHVREVAAMAEELDRDGLATLLSVVAEAVAFYAWSGYENNGLQLADRVAEAAGLLPAEHPARLYLAHERAWVAGRHGRWREAVGELRRILDARTRVLGPDHVDTLDTRHKLAWGVGKLGDWTSTEAELRLVLNARATLLGANHPDTLHTRCCLAWATAQVGRLAEAEAAYRDVISVRSRVLGEEHIETWDARHSLAETFVQYGRYREAEMLLRELIAARESLPQLELPDTLEVRPRYWLAQALRGQGRHDAAAREFARLLVDQERALGDHPATRETRRQLAA